MPSEFRKHVGFDEPKPTTVVGFAGSPSIARSNDGLERSVKDDSTETARTSIAPTAEVFRPTTG